MKTLLPLLLLARCALGASISFSWEKQSDPSVTNYNLYYGDKTHTYSNTIACGDVTSYTVTNLANGANYFFSLTSVTSTGLETPYATEIGGTVPMVPKIIQQPVSAVMPTGANVTFAVQAEGPDLMYQWFKNGTAISGATQATMSLYSVVWQQNGTYTVGITNIAGGVESTGAALSVIPPAPKGFKKTSVGQ